MKAGNVWAVALLAALQVPGAMARSPNVVLLIGDDVGYSDLGAYGGEIDTPNLDALATAGTLFTNYHTTASCSPTRAMLMTGVDNHRNGLGNMDIVMPAEHKGKPGYDGVLNDRVVTIAQRLRDNGYHTYHIGKWHLGNAPEKRAYNRGFERTISLGDTGADNWEQRSYLPFYDKAHWYADGAEHQLPDDFYSSRYFVDKAIEFIDENHADGQPFFANIGFQAVHIPIQAPAEFVDKYVDRYDVGWHAIRQQRRDRAVERGLIPPEAEFATMSSTEDWDSLSARDRAYNARKMAVYAGMLEAMDFHVGRLIDYLKRIGEYENTVFIFLSDNGAEPSDPLAFRTMAAWVNFNYSIALEDLGSKGSYAAIGPSWASAAVSPGAYFKFWAGEGGVRVPLIVSWPGQLAGGQIQKALTHVKDIAPTILELTNTPVTGDVYQQKIVEPITGVSLGALLRREIPRFTLPTNPSATNWPATPPSTRVTTSCCATCRRWVMANGTCTTSARTRVRCMTCGNACRNATPRCWPTMRPMPGKTASSRCRKAMTTSSRPTVTGRRCCCAAGGQPCSPPSPRPCCWWGAVCT